MDNLVIKGDKGIFFIPNINFNAETGKFLFSGASYVENTFEFYDPILEWLTEYCEDISRTIDFEMRLEYMNTSSSKSVLELFYILSKFKEEGGKINFDWYVLEDDLDMVDEIEDYMIDTGLVINIIKIDEF